MGEITRKSHLSPKTSERTLPQGITANIFHVKYKLYNPNELDKMFLQKFAVSKWAKNMKTDLSCSIIVAGGKGEKCQTCKVLTADPKGKRPTSRNKNFEGFRAVFKNYFLLFFSTFLVNKITVDPVDLSAVRSIILT